MTVRMKGRYVILIKLTHLLNIFHCLTFKMWTVRKLVLFLCSGKSMKSAVLGPVGVRLALSRLMLLDRQTDRQRERGRE